jgi:hypothetical protein
LVVTKQALTYRNSSLQRIESSMQQRRLTAQALGEAPETLDDELRLLIDENSSPTESLIFQSELLHEREAGAAIRSSNLASAETGHEPQMPLRLNNQTLGAGDIARRLTILSLPQQEEIAEVILENCRASCFAYYLRNSLWRKKFSTED